ncbi:MAG: amino acid ABC transporter substrate-binding protein [Andreesenia angusta]|nr:amino acid ABC transporter substrate-binding protein [Andreesenia angusta]
MKKRLGFLAIAVLSVGLLFGCGDSKDDTANNTDKGKIVVGLDDSFPPMGFKDEDGELVGFDIDLAKEVAKEMDMEVEFKPQDWDGIVLSLNKGDIDVIWNGFTITEERKKEVNFTDAYLDNRQVLVVKEDSEYEKQEDLDGKTLGIQLGSSAEKALNAHEDFKSNLKEVKSYSNNVEALMDLDAGRVDTVLVDEIVAKYFIAKKDGHYKVLDQDLGKEEYGVGVSKDNEELLEKLNTALEKVKNSEEGKKISEEWFTEDILAK